MKTLIETIVSALVDHPDAVTVTFKERSGKSMFMSYPFIRMT